MYADPLPTDLPRCLVHSRRIRREVDATVADYMRLRNWDVALAVSVVLRMLHHKNVRGVLHGHWTVLLLDYQPGTSSNNSSVASQAAEVTRRLLLRLLPFRPELFTSTVCTLLLDVLHDLMFLSGGIGGSDGDSSLRGPQHEFGSNQQYEDAVECALRVLEGPTGQQQQQQPAKLLAPGPAMCLLEAVSYAQCAPQLRVLHSSRCAALVMRCLFDPLALRSSWWASLVLSRLFKTHPEETHWAVDPVLATSTIRGAFGQAEACMVWHASYSNTAFVQLARLPYATSNCIRQPMLKAFDDQAFGCDLLTKALQPITTSLPAAKAIESRTAAAHMIMCHPGLLRALCTLCDSAARHAPRDGVVPRSGGELWFDTVAVRVVELLAQCVSLIRIHPHPGPAHIYSMAVGFGCLLRVCEHVPRHRATTSAVLLSFAAWRCIDAFCYQAVHNQTSGVEVHSTAAVLAVLNKSHALERLLKAAQNTERWLEGRPGGVADVTGTQPCRVVNALLAAALLIAREHASLKIWGALSSGHSGDETNSTPGQQRQQQQRQQHEADVQRIYTALVKAHEGMSPLRVPALVPELVRDLQRAVTALALLKTCALPNNNS